MKNWKYNLGGALSGMGHTLGAAGSLPLACGVHSQVLAWTAFAGFVVNAFGDFFSKLFPSNVRAEGAEGAEGEKP